MELINPITFSSAMLTSTTASESVALWSAATAYTALQYARLDTTHRIYQCIIGNTNASPDANLTGASPKWIDAGATNAYAMFDEKWGTQTTAVSSLTVVLTPLVPIDSLAVLNMLGSTLVVSCTVAGSQIYTKTISLQTDVGVFDWKSYFLAPIVAAVDKVITDLFPYALQVITLTISGPGAVAIGNVSMGALVSLGRLWNSPTIGITDYSTKSVDTFGNVVVVKRAYSKRFGAKFSCASSFVDQLAPILASVRATPVVWMGLGSTYSSLVVWGYFKDFEIDIAYDTVSYCTINIEGII